MLQHVSVRAPRNIYTMKDLRQTNGKYKSVCKKNMRKTSTSGYCKCQIDLSFFLDLQFPLSKCTFFWTLRMAGLILYGMYTNKSTVIKIYQAGQYSDMSTFHSSPRLTSTTSETSPFITVQSISNSTLIITISAHNT